MDPKDRVMPHDYKMAILSQDGCNLSVLIHSLDRIVSLLWNEAKQNGHGTDWVEEHPIIRLYVEQIYWLAAERVCCRSYEEAHEICEREGGKE